MRTGSEMIDALPAAVYTTDAEGRLTYFNAAAVAMSGRTPELGTDQWCVSWKLYNADGTPLPHDRCPMAIALNEGRIVRGAELIVERPDGSRVWVEPHPTPLCDASGKIVGGINMLLDISDRKRTEDALRSSRERLTADLAGMTRIQQLSTRLVPAGELNSLLRDILAGAADLTGTPKGNIQLYDASTGQLRIVVHQGFGARYLEHFTDAGVPAICGLAARLGQRVLFEDVTVEPSLQGRADLDVVLEDGIRAIQSTPLVSRDGQLLGLLNNHYPVPHRPTEHELRFLDLLARQAADVIERARAEEELRRLAADLRDTDRRKDEFLATLAHELRNPLAPILNSLETMKRAGDDASLLERARATIERQVAHTVRLVDDLLDVSRISSSKLELRRERVELASVIHSAVEACAPLVESLAHELQVSLPAEPIQLSADPTRLAQVFGNLLNNAAKFTPRTGRIWLTAERQGGDVVVRVGDTGIGIPSDELQSIFDMFSQVDRTLERSHGGLGIGLHLARRVVELHDGKIEAHSEGEGRGSEFVVRLPVAVGAMQGDRAEGRVGAAQAASARRVLVVDDNRDAAESLALLLTLRGHESFVAHDGLDAVQRAVACDPDVILMDIGLPRLNGYDACREIRRWSSGRALRIVAMTGWGQEGDRQMSRDAGFDEHLVKPPNFEQLMSLIESSPTDGEPTASSRQ